MGVSAVRIIEHTRDMTLDRSAGAATLDAPQDDLAFLLALVALGDRDALLRIVDQTHQAVERWLSAGIAAGPRRDRLLVRTYTEVWARAEQFPADVMSPLRWIALVALDVVRAGVAAGTPSQQA